MLRRGAVEMLALGWLSVEDDRGAGNHPHRLQNVSPGQSLTEELAARLLREILANHKGVLSQAEQNAWICDCLGALTAAIRPDAVWVNRAGTFAEWQGSVADGRGGMPEHARRVLFSMCGTEFASLTLPDQAALLATTRTPRSRRSRKDSRTRPTRTKHPGESIAISSVAKPVRGLKRTGAKGNGGPFDECLRLVQSEAPGLPTEILQSLPVGTSRCDPATALEPQLRKWRLDSGFPISGNAPLPPEVDFRTNPNAVSRRYAKLLAVMGLWAGGEDLGGSSARYQRAGERIRQNAEKKGFRIAERPEIVGLVDELLDACWKVATEEDLRVFKPAWAAAVQEQFDNACKITLAMPGAPEYRYLMFALAARRITQTQSWTRRNEAERHKAGLRKDAASTALEKLDLGAVPVTGLRITNANAGNAQARVAIFV